MSAREKHGNFGSSEIKAFYSTTIGGLLRKTISFRFVPPHGYTSIVTNLQKATSPHKSPKGLDIVECAIL